MRDRTRLRRPLRDQGLTLVELLIAMVLGILVAGGIITVFLSTSASNKAQTQMATLQETGRYAMTRLEQDISMANALYCSGSGGPGEAPAAGQPLLDMMRTPTVFFNDPGGLINDHMADMTSSWGNPYPDMPLQPFALPEFVFMRGYDCPASGGCVPEDPATSTDIPAAGTAIGNRVKGASVLTLRYVDPGMGWKLGYPGGSSITGDGSDLVSINLAPMGSEPALNHFSGTDLAMMADCSAAVIFGVTGQGGAVLSPTSNFAAPGDWSTLEGVRIFNFDKDFKTVTYYLRVMDDGGRTIGALIRRENGEEQELVRGVERLDFRYGVMLADGNTRLMTADQVDNAPITLCPPPAPEPSGGTALANRKGCLWRAVQSIEVAMLVNGQTPLGSLSDDELAYTYSIDGITTPRRPDQHNVKPEADQGFNKRLLRREFTALVAVRNYNP